MAKRITGVGNNKKTRSKKTASRIAKKMEMLKIKAMKPAERKKALAELKK